MKQAMPAHQIVEFEDATPICMMTVTHQDPIPVAPGVQIACMSRGDNRHMAKLLQQLGALCLARSLPSNFTSDFNP